MLHIQYLHQCLRLVFILGLAISGVTLFIYTWYYLYPFLIALLIAWLLQPFIRLLEVRLLIPRTIAILLLLSLLLSLIGSIVTLVIAEFIKGVQLLSHGTPEQFKLLISHLLEQISKLVTPIIERGEGIFGGMEGGQKHTILQSFSSLKEQAAETGANLISSLLEGITKGLTTIPSSLAILLVGILATFFLCKDWDIIQNTAHNIIPNQIRHTAHNIFKDLSRTLGGILKAQLILTAISMTIIYTGLVIMNIPHSFTITIVSALVDFIPYIGTGVIFIPWIAYQFLAGEYEVTIGLAIVYILVILTRQSLEPKLLASQFGVPPIVLLVGLFLGFQLVGIYGMFLGPMVIAFIKTLHNTGVILRTWNFIKGQK